MFHLIKDVGRFDVIQKVYCSCLQVTFMMFRYFNSNINLITRTVIYIINLFILFNYKQHSLISIIIVC